MYVRTEYRAAEQYGTRIGFCFFCSLERGRLKNTVAYVSGNSHG